MSAWKRTILSNIIELLGGGTPKTTCNEYWNGNIPWLSVVDFNNGLKYVSQTEKNITQKGLENSSAKLLSAGDIIISARGTIGALAILKKTMSFNQSCYGVRGKKDIAITDWVYYQLKNIVDEFSQKSHGGVFDTITRSTFNEIEIELPSVLEQKAIASALSSFDDKIDLLHRQNKTLESMAETLFRQCFNNYLQTNKKCGCVGDLFSPLKGKNITRKNVVKDGSYPVVAGGLEPSCFHNKYNTQKPVITISASGANAGFVRLYHTNVWSSDSSYIDKSIFPYIYYAYILLKINQNTLFDSQVGSAQPHIYPKNIMELELSIPPISYIKDYDDQVAPFFKKIEFNDNQIKSLSDLRDTLLPKLMSGEVRVKLD